MYTSTLLLTLATATLTSAHGRIVNITTSSGTVYEGWDPELALASTAPPPRAAWSASNLGNIYVSPSSFASPDIACHFNGKPGALHINTSAGDSLVLRWNEWPVSHKGPVLTYLAACNGSCADVYKEKLEWVKINEMGWLNSTGWEIGLGGTWASDILIANRFEWVVKVPEGLMEGGYVLRHEIIALHVANETNGAQAYPQCVNIHVVGKKDGGMGTRKIEGGLVGSELYLPNDKGILVDIHTKMDGYKIPGPGLWEGASKVQQPNERRQAAGASAEDGQGP